MVCAMLCGGEASTDYRRVGLQHSSGEAGRLSITSSVVGFRQLSDCNQAIRQLTKLMLLHVARYYSTVTSLLNLVYTDSGKGPVL